MIMRKTSCTLAAMLLLAFSVYAHPCVGQVGGDTGGGTPGPGGCSFSIDCSGNGPWITDTIVVRGTAVGNSAGLVQVTLDLPIIHGDCDSLGMPVGQTTVSVDPVTCEFEATFVHMYNAFTVWPGVCPNPNSSFAPDFYRVSVGGAKCCFQLSIDCYDLSCCNECLYEEFCTSMCDAIGLFPEHPYCDFF